MIRKKGRLMYVPGVFVEEVDNRLRDFPTPNNKCNSIVIKSIVQDSKIGKEQKKIMRAFGFIK